MSNMVERVETIG